MRIKQKSIYEAPSRLHQMLLQNGREQPQAWALTCGGTQQTVGSGTAGNFRVQSSKHNTVPGGITPDHWDRTSKLPSRISKNPHGESVTHFQHLEVLFRKRLISHSSVVLMSSGVPERGPVSICTLNSGKAKAQLDSILSCSFLLP